MSKLMSLFAITSWAYARETSIEIAQAIAEMAGCAPSKMCSIWDDPTPIQQADVVCRAWSMADDDEAELHWGDEVYMRSFESHGDYGDQPWRETIEAHNADIAIDCVNTGYIVSIGPGGRPASLTLRSRWQGSRDGVRWTTSDRNEVAGLIAAASWGWGSHPDAVDDVEAPPCGLTSWMWAFEEGRMHDRVHFRDPARGDAAGAWRCASTGHVVQ